MITNIPRTSTFTPARCRRVFSSLLLLAAFVAILVAIVSSRQPAVAAPGAGSGSFQSSKIAPWVMEHTANGQQAEFFVVLADQADLSGAASLPTKAEKGRFVYETLLSKAQSTQEPILQWLRDRKVEHQSFYIVNAILVKGTREIADSWRLARTWREWKAIRVSTMTFLNLARSSESPLQPSSTPATIEPGINYTHAPDVWALGLHRPKHRHCERRHRCSVDT